MEKEIKEKRKFFIKNKKNIIIITVSILILCLLFSIIFAIINIFNSKVIKGVTIEKIDVSGNTKSELENKLDSLVNENNSKNIILKYNDTQTTITVKDLETNYNVNDVTDEAYLVGRTKNIFINNFEILQALIFKHNININENINEDKLNNAIDSTEESLPGLVQEYSYYIEGEELIITSGKEGIKVDKELLNKRIKEAISDYSNSSVVVNIPVYTKTPDKIDINKIHSEIYKETQDAYISQNPTTVHPNINGVDFAISIDEAKKIIEEVKDEYTIPLKITIATKTLKDLGKEAFPNTLGTFSTKYDVANSNRTNNIKLATGKINETIIMPGETFSYNQTLGKRSIESGYKEAGAYVNGKIVQEVGGGICQVSSTLYNAALYANLEIIERHNHYFESSYVAAGRDATVSWGTVDFKFKNNRTYPIKIEATSRNGVEIISICGIKEEKEYEVTIQSKKISTIDRTTQYEDDDTIENGKEIVTQTGHDGCISETYKIVKLNGEIISNDLISRDTYKPLEKIIKRGTKTVDTYVNEEEKNVNTNVNNIDTNLENNILINTIN